MAAGAGACLHACCTALVIARLVFPFARRSRRAAPRAAAGRAGMLRVMGIGVERQRHAAAGAGAAGRQPCLVARHPGASTPSRPARFVSKADVRRWPLLGCLVAARRHAVHRARAQARRAARRPPDGRGAARRRHASRCFRKARPATARRCCRSTPTCCRPRSPTGTPVQPVALRYADADGAVQPAGRRIVGETTLLQSAVARRLRRARPVPTVAPGCRWRLRRRRARWHRGRAADPGRARLAATLPDQAAGSPARPRAAELGSRPCPAPPPRRRPPPPPPASPR